MGTRSFFGLLADGPGKRVRTSQIVDETSTIVHIQAGSIADPDSTSIANVKPAGVGASLADAGVVVLVRDGVSVSWTGQTVALGAGSATVGAISNTTFTANAGTNLNTSALALESGGNLATVASAQGASATGVTQPTGGSGILGWLSGIFNKLNTSIAVTGTFWQATQPVSQAALTPVATSAAASSLVLKASAGNLLSLACAPTATGYLMLFDATSAPADGAVAPKWVQPVFANGGASWSWSNPMSFATGVVAVFSSTGPFTKTASATAFISGQVQ